MKFDAYLLSTAETVDEFAKRSGVPAQTIYKYLQGTRKPLLGSRNLRLIADASDRKVTEYDWYDIPLPTLVSKRSIQNNPNRHGGLE